jgi:hypothetical protein
VDPDLKVRLCKCSIKSPNNRTKHFGGGGGIIYERLGKASNQELLCLEINKERR